MPTHPKELHIEDLALDLFAEVGHGITQGVGLRDAFGHSSSIIPDRVKNAVRKVNPQL